MSPARIVALGAIWLALGCIHRPLDLGAVDAADGGADAPPDGPDTLVLQIVDGRRGRPPDPVEGATVVVDAGGIRRTAITDADGRANVGGLDFAAAAADVTVHHDGFPLLTVLGLGADGSVPPPVVVALGTFDDCRRCGLALPRVTGPLVRTGADTRTRVLTTLSGFVTGSSSEAWYGYHSPELGSASRVVGVELSSDGSAVIGYGEAEVDGADASPTLVLRAPAGSSVATVTVDRRLDAVADLRSLPARLLVVDERDGGGVRAALGSAELASPDGSHAVGIPYAAAAEGAPYVQVEVADLDDRNVSGARRALGDDGALALDAPPALESASFQLPRDVVRFSEPPADDEVLALYLTTPTGVAWTVLLPAGAGEARLPTVPPPARSLLPRGDSFGVLAARYRFDADAHDGHAMLGPGWFISRIAQWAWDGSATATLR